MKPSNHTTVHNTYLQQLQDDLHTANAILERVRALADASRDPKHGPGGCGIYSREIYEALADQPEAPKGQEWHETAKEVAERSVEDFSAAKLQADLAKAEARLADYQAMVDDLEPYDILIHWRQDRADLAAANARAEKAEAMSVQARMLLKEDGEMQAELDAANARADAAERDAAAADREVKHLVGQVLFQEKAYSVLQTKRDQLAARVTGLEHWYSESPSRCTPEERKVLEAEEDTESLIEQLDEALCSLLHQGDEIGTHAPREHLDLFYQRQTTGTLYLASVEGLRSALAAANARADAAERDVDFWKKAAKNLGYERIAESSRADAAEREKKTLSDWFDACRAEREQLAARLESAHACLLARRERCTPEEREVLEAMKELRITVADVGFGGQRNVNYGDVLPVLEAELANRAAKAKRGTDGGSAP